MSDRFLLKQASLCVCVCCYNHTHTFSNTVSILISDNHITVNYSSMLHNTSSTNYCTVHEKVKNLSNLHRQKI